MTYQIERVEDHGRIEPEGKSIFKLLEKQENGVLVRERQRVRTKRKAQIDDQADEQADPENREYPLSPPGVIERMFQRLEEVTEQDRRQQIFPHKSPHPVQHVNVKFLPPEEQDPSQQDQKPPQVSIGRATKKGYAENSGPQQQALQDTGDDEQVDDGETHGKYARSLYLIFARTQDAVFEM